MKQKWNQEMMEAWAKSQVEHPSSAFEKKSEQWLRNIRNQANSSPKSFAWSKITWILAPSLLTIAMLWIINTETNPIQINPASPDKSGDYDTLVKMDECLESGIVLLNPEQMEILQALSEMADLSQATTWITSATNT